MSFFVNFLETLDEKAAETIKKAQTTLPTLAVSASVPSVAAEPPFPGFPRLPSASSPPPAGPLLPTSYSAHVLPSAPQPRTVAKESGDAVDVDALFSFLNEEPAVGSAPSDGKQRVRKEDERTEKEGEEKVEEEEKRGVENPRLKMRMLESKLQSYQNEIATLTGHVRHFSAALDAAHEQSRKAAAVAASREKELQSLKDAESQFDEVLRGKDQRQADVEVELEEAQQDCEAARGELQAWQHKWTVLCDEKAAVEASLRQCQAEVLSLQKDRNERSHELEQRAADASSTVMALQHAISAKELEVTAARKQCEEAQAKSASLQLELKEYHLRAASVLEAKDRLIASLSKGSSLESTGGESQQNQYLNQPQQSTPLIAEQLAVLQAQLDSSRAQQVTAERSLEETQSQLQAVRDLHASESAHYSEALSKTEQQSRQHQIEAARASAELAEVRGLLEQQVQTLQHAAENQALEMQVLERQLKAKSLTPSAVELEARALQLSDVVAKQQRQLEALRTHNVALQMQLEQASQARPEKRQGPDSQEGSSSHQHLSVGMDLFSDPSAPGLLPVRRRGAAPKLRSLASLAPNLSGREDGLAAAILKTAERLDSFSSFFISFIQEYPLSRLLLFLYLLLLHLWSIFLFQHMLQPHQGSPLPLP